MSRYIDADAVAKEIKQDIADAGLTERFVFYRINEAPSIDICFCKECKWFDSKGHCMRLTAEFGIYEDVRTDDFCSYGERSE